MPTVDDLNLNHVSKRLLFINNVQKYFFFLKLPCKTQKNTQKLAFFMLFAYLCNVLLQ